MQKTTIVLHTEAEPRGENVERWVCLRGHPHPTSAGAETCETNVGLGLTDAELFVLFDAEVVAFNA